MAADVRLRLALTAFVLTLAAGLTGAASTPASHPPAMTSPAWRQLTPQQRSVLAPLSSEWNRMPEERRQKWLGIAKRYPSLTPQEQLRMQQRMKDWASLSAAEREQARQQYLKLRKVPAEQRRELSAKWREYEALSSEDKARLKATKVSVAPVSKATAKRSTTAPAVKIAKPVVMVPPGPRPRPPVQQSAPEEVANSVGESVATHVKIPE